MLTLWCMFRSPLMIGTELTTLDEWTYQLLTNRDLLALMGADRRGKQIRRDEGQAVWINTDHKTGEKCVALFNLDDQETQFGIALQEVGIQEQACRIYELWDKQELLADDGQLRVSVPAHGVKVYRLLK